MLSPNAQKILNEYFNLPFPGVLGVRCPYFNNARRRRRAQLRVLVGKGMPREIVEEAQIISLQYRAGIFDHSGNCCLHGGEHAGSHANAEEIRKFLIDNDLGVECSGFVTQILRAHFLETKNIDIAHRFQKVSPRKFLRYLIAGLRPIENISARTYVDDANTSRVDNISAVQPGDVIVVLETIPDHKRNHILLVTENNNDVVKYAHARAWSREGKYGHGVAEGEIKLIKPNEGLLSQEWSELGFVGLDNETFVEVKEARRVEIRRVKGF